MNASAPLRIRVTQDCIDDIAGSHCKYTADKVADQAAQDCPIARAFRFTLNRAAAVYYAADLGYCDEAFKHAIVSIGTEEYRLPQSCVDFMHKWDNPKKRSQCRPFEFLFSYRPVPAAWRHYVHDGPPTDQYSVSELDPKKDFSDK